MYLSHHPVKGLLLAALLACPTLANAEASTINGTTPPQAERQAGDTQEEAIWKELEQRPWVRDGNVEAERILYSFTDMNCPYCRELWEETRPWVEAGIVQIRHIPVGILEADSPMKAMSLMAADDPERALADHYRGVALKPLDELPPELELALYRNHQLMEGLGLVATPALVYRQDGQLLQAQGVPSIERLEEIMGSPRP